MCSNDDEICDGAIPFSHCGDVANGTDPDLVLWVLNLCWSSDAHNLSVVISNSACVPAYGGPVDSCLAYIRNVDPAVNSCAEVCHEVPLVETE